MHKPKIDREAWQAIEQVRSSLLRSTEIIEEIDFGAGLAGQQHSPKDQHAGLLTRNRVSYVASFSKESRWAELLFYLARYRRPKKVLEMGTCVGISASYIAKALQLNGGGHVWTLEGSPATAALAQETFAKVRVAEYVSSLVGPFYQTLQTCLAENCPVELVFVDGHHNGAATLGYFEKITPYLGFEAIVVFDDIFWSDDMTKAWNKIRSQQIVRGHLSVGGMGVLVV